MLPVALGIRPGDSYCAKLLGDDLYIKLHERHKSYESCQ